MAYLKINNVSIKGVAATVPKEIKEIKNQPFFSKGEAEKVIALTHIERSRIAPSSMCCSDLCMAAAEKLIADLKWGKSEIEALVFVSLSRDYISPNTSSILQYKLGLPKTCYAIDVPFACSGYVYGISILASLMQTGMIKKGLLLVGETTSKLQSPLDKTLWPLHGDAGTATAFEFDKNASPMMFNCCTDGSMWNALINPDGGTRNPITEKSLEMVEVEPGIVRNRTHSIMDGMNVFGFSVKEPPRSIIDLCENFKLDLSAIDMLLLHQANKYIDDKIAKKLKISEDKVPFSLMQYGNTSSASIPMTMVVATRKKLTTSKNNVIMCGFGSGMSWAAAYITLENIVCPELIELDWNEET